MIPTTTRDEGLLRCLNLKLAALAQPTSRATADPYFLEIAGPLLRNHYQKDQLLGDRLCPVDARIQAFLDAYLAAGGGLPRGRPASANAFLNGFNQDPRRGITVDAIVFEARIDDCRNNHVLISFVVSTFVEGLDHKTAAHQSFLNSPKYVQPDSIGLLVTKAGFSLRADRVA